jgi:hypothetical protein
MFLIRHSQVVEQVAGRRFEFTPQEVVLAILDQGIY